MNQQSLNFLLTANCHTLCKNPVNVWQHKERYHKHRQNIKYLELSTQFISNANTKEFTKALVGLRQRGVVALHYQR